MSSHPSTHALFAVSHTQSCLHRTLLLVTQPSDRVPIRAPFPSLPGETAVCSSHLPLWPLRSCHQSYGNRWCGGDSGPPPTLGPDPWTPCMWQPPIASAAQLRLFPWPTSPQSQHSLRPCFRAFGSAECQQPATASDASTVLTVLPLRYPGRHCLCAAALSLLIYYPPGPLLVATQLLPIGCLSKEPLNPSQSLTLPHSPMRHTKFLGPLSNPVDFERLQLSSFKKS